MAKYLSTFFSFQILFSFHDSQNCFCHQTNDHDGHTLRPSYERKRWLLLTWKALRDVQEHEMAIIYERLKMEEAGGSVSQRALERAASVSQKVAAKIIEEVESGGLIDPSTVKQGRATGAGSKTLAFNIEMLLVDLRMWHVAAIDDIEDVPNFPFSGQ
jgi:predicted transcriptional regulator